MSKIEKSYELAKAQYAAFGIDTDAAIEKALEIPISLHCWQADDNLGFEPMDEVSSGGGILVTGNHPGRARTSPLIWYLIGRNTSQRWDAAHRTSIRIEHPMPERGELTQQELQTFVEWVDLGALFDKLPGMRSTLPTGGQR